MGAISTAFYLGYELKYIANKLEKFEGVGGRMEFINAKQNFTCIVDYAHEESGMEFLCKWAKKVVGSSKKSIILLGAEGGGRDEKKRPIMGKIAAENCDYLIISNVDPYDDNPKKIITDIVKGAASVRKDLHSVFMIEDRREGIKKALSLAKKGDLVLITGKGSEQSMIIGEKKIKWDDRLVVKEEIKKLLNKK
jgi:UDP-N-acetylmuramoyl-L-alanyl-D-glutamate--2,6-diaminopimelate ligase